jgi:putative aldouronate transport system substrate-binding protein
VWNGDPLFYGRRVGLIVGKNQECKPKSGEYVPSLNFTEDELNQINEIQTTLKTYVKESKTRFVTGDMNIDKDWDAYIKEINNIGLDKFLKVCQTAYDRMYK